MLVLKTLNRDRLDFVKIKKNQNFKLFDVFLKIAHVIDDISGKF